ncbi:hypothetical protein HYALB_00010214 [Hymenoscyphus albidus]|uniref:Uncharacterized protein n=1 Tax=Hymenoscyphus albidus TaxID=595503 RepID=A0A9N9LTH0_9HELO|nr:hypothetical protein HYALB_00010214 [Hymenoscyphus albidus]
MDQRRSPIIVGWYVNCTLATNWETVPWSGLGVRLDIEWVNKHDTFINIVALGEAMPPKSAYFYTRGSMPDVTIQPPFKSQKL